MNPSNALPPVHPGEFLKEILDELGISQTAFARAVKYSLVKAGHLFENFAYDT